MSTIVTRSGKGSPLTNTEVDANFTNLNTDKAELSGATFTGEITANGGIALGDGDVATFNSNLSIFSSGTTSYIQEAGAGDLYLKASSLYITDRDNNQFMTLVDNGTGGTVSLMHNTATKLATTATGIDVTGTANATNMQVSNGGKYIFGGENTRITGETDGSGKIRLFTGGTEKVILDDANVGIGTSSPSAKLDVSGEIFVIYL